MQYPQMKTARSQEVELGNGKIFHWFVPWPLQLYPGRNHRRGRISMHTASFLEIWEAQLWRNMSKSLQQSFGTIELWYRFSRGGFMSSLFDIGSCASESSSIDRSIERERERLGPGLCLRLCFFLASPGRSRTADPPADQGRRDGGGGGAKAPEILCFFGSSSSNPGRFFLFSWSLEQASRKPRCARLA